MKYQKHFQPYINDLAARKPAPGGGSAIALTFCIGVSLIEKAIRYSQPNDKKFKDYLQQLQQLRRQVLPAIDKDGQLFQKVMESSGAQKKQALAKSEALIVMVAKSCKSVFLLAKKAKSGIKKGILSDFTIGKELVKIALEGCIFNLQANTKLFGKKSRYEAIFKKIVKSQRVREPES